jgi:protein-tyrosine phosphatase
VQNILQNIKLKSILNFRDVGGIPLENGRVMKPGIIYRSANPDRITRSDAEKIKNLGIRTIIDLRGEHEIRKNRVKIDGAETIPMPLDFELKTRERLMPYIRKKGSEDKIAEISNDLYIDIVDASAPVLKNVLEVILTPSKTPVLIHCQAGKDRTGVISALIQYLLGAERQTIAGHYMESNDELIPYFKKMLLIRKILSLGFFPSKMILYAITLRQQNIESVIERIESRHGGVESYLSSAGFDTRQIDRLRELLTE